MHNTIIISVDELWLKGKNRPLYYKAMKEHIRAVTKAFHQDQFSCVNEFQRLVLKSDSLFSHELIEALLKVPGISFVSPASTCSPNVDEIRAAVMKEMSFLEKLPSTFRVTTKRVDKRFPMNSMDFSREIGGMLLSEFDGQLRVDLHRPEMVVDIKILPESAYIATQVLPGIGGLPVGTNGHLITLLSGGFDSPVASYMMSKRGCQQTFAFFYAYPFVGDEVKEKIIELTAVLGQFQKRSTLYVIPFGKVQDQIAKDCREEYRTIFFRRFMVETSDRLAKRVRAQALLTGDALGQVSSQTMGNITVVDNSIKRPILRPLIGFNKFEIIELAKKIGTHDISVRPHDDACALFAPKRPIIKPDWKYWNDFARDHDYSALLEECLDNAELYDVSFTGEMTQL